jgi:hypothetical protein
MGDMWSRYQDSLSQKEVCPECEADIEYGEEHDTDCEMKEKDEEE